MENRKDVTAADVYICKKSEQSVSVFVCRKYRYINYTYSPVADPSMCCRVIIKLNMLIGSMVKVMSSDGAPSVTV